MSSGQIRSDRRPERADGWQMQVPQFELAVAESPHSRRLLPLRKAASRMCTAMASFYRCARGHAYSPTDKY
eukprot:732969-Amphidinium_carterae.1